MVKTLDYSCPEEWVLDANVKCMCICVYISISLGQVCFCFFCWHNVSSELERVALHLPSLSMTKSIMMDMFVYFYFSASWIKFRQ